MSKYADTLKNMSTTIVPEDVWRDVLLIAFEHATDTNKVTIGSLSNINDVLETVFPDSGFAVVNEQPALYTSIQRNVLETVAEACPYDYGPGVYLARTMLSVADTNLYSFINDCEKGPQPPSQRLAQPEEDGQNEEVEELLVSVYPNPNNGEITIALLGGEVDAEYTLKISSLLGAEVYQTNLRSGNNGLRLPLSAGSYLYNILDSHVDEIIDQGNVIIMQK